MAVENLKEYWSLPSDKQDEFFDKTKHPVSKSTRNPLEQVFGRSVNTILRKTPRTIPHRKSS